MTDHKHYFQEAAREAEMALCYRARCGSVIVSQNGSIIGRGHNSPPLDDESRRTCEKEWNLVIKPKYDKTCCVHAEWNAILDASRSHPDKLNGSTLYYMQIDADSKFINAGVPYCTTCSRLSLASGISNFALWNDRPDICDTKEYDLKSYGFYQI